MEVNTRHAAPCGHARWMNTNRCTDNHCTNHRRWAAKDREQTLALIDQHIAAIVGLVWDNFDVEPPPEGSEFTREVTDTCGLGAFRTVISISEVHP